MKGLAIRTTVVGVAIAALGGVPAAAQERASAPVVADRASPQMQARYQIAVMEGVLERAVQLGARRLGAQVRAVSPGLLFISGAARARGFWLEGYGIFFDVDVPAMKRSLAWSFRVLDAPSREMETTFAEIRAHLEGFADPKARRAVEVALQRLERQSALTPAASPAAQAPQGEPAVLQDPGLAYTAEVKQALVDAIIDYGQPIAVGDGEWFTVAARDNSEGPVGATDPYDVSTIVIRVNGADLGAYRARRISRDDLRQRVQVREY